MEPKANSEFPESKRPLSPSSIGSLKRKGRKFFLAGCNTLLGYCLADELRNDHLEDDETAIQFVGTLDPLYPNDPAPANVRKVVAFPQKHLFSKALLSAEVIIYPLSSTDPAELRFAISQFKETEFDTEKVFILISSVLVWCKTKVHPSALIEDWMFPSRSPPPYNQEWKLAENDVMASCRTRVGKNCAAVHPFKRAYVICPGLIYGLGEEYESGFASTFMSAWNNKGDSPMNVIGDGGNTVPTVYVKDLAKMIKKVLEMKPDPLEHPYIFAVDKGSLSQTQKSIVNAVGKKFGIEKIQAVEKKEECENLGIDLKVKLSSVLEEAMGKDEDWHCKNGFAAGVDKVFEEFRAAKGLRSLRIVLIGPPLSGKTYFADWLSQKYGVSSIKIKETLDSARSADNDLGKSLREELERLKQQKVEELKLLAKKKRGMKVDPDLVVPRFTAEMLHKTYISRLAQKAFANKGYILDGFPRDFTDACEMFLEIPKMGEDEEKDYEQYKPNTKLPNKVILIESASGDDEIWTARADAIPEQMREGTHYDSAGMLRRVQEYNARHDESQGLPPLIEFFGKRGVEVLKLNTEKPVEELFKEMAEYIEKDGKMVGDVGEEKVEVQTAPNDEDIADMAKEDAEQVAIKLVNDLTLGDNTTKNKEAERLKEKERNLLEVRSYKMRKLMMERLVPVLGEGILLMCKDQPQDPIAFLTEFLEKRSEGRAKEERAKMEKLRAALMQQQQLRRAMEIKKEVKSPIREDSEESSSQNIS